MTRAETEKAAWDVTQQLWERLTPLERDMFYFKANREGLRMDGIEYRMQKAMTERWKKENQ